ncbi:hypothetical protein [Neobacillus sp. D3-1R]|uniref:hypothetical protein n=1 Tax=Neobacillus sp. D3-1R TaxID=3445778 RepID=UPI003FA0F9A7
MALGIVVGAINVNSQNTNSTISVGENQMPGWAAHRKINNGIGAQMGIFLTTGNGAFILDTDAIDGQMNNANVSPSAQNQAL